MKKVLALISIVILLCGCSIQSTESYYNSTENNGEYTAKISISCETAVKYKNREKAAILEPCSIGFNDGDTVFDILKTACKLNEIQFEYEGSGNSVYISGIDYLYEFDCGDLSGWEYSVNGEFPSVGCNAYKLKDGDEISWLYTCNLGADIGNKYTP